MAVYIVKPEALSRREEIREFIEKHSYLVVSKATVIIMDELAINNLFPDDLGTPLMDAIRAHMLGKSVEVNVVESSVGLESEVSIGNELVRITGASFIPAQCEVNTVRFVFGSNEINWYCGQPYYLNAVHRTTAGEASIVTEWVQENIFR